MKTYGFVFARGGSKGVPGKNIRALAGKPLIGHSIDIGHAIPDIDKMFVSTDSEDIASVAKDFGASVIERPPELGKDNSSEWSAWEHAVQWVYEKEGQFDCFVSLPATAPLRNSQDVERCLASLDSNTNGVLTMTPAHRNPWFNMAKIDSNGFLSLFLDDKEITRRQDAPEAYDLTTVAYVMRPDFVLRAEGLWEGRLRGVVVPQERAIDIDSELDFRIAEFLMSELKTEGGIHAG